MPLKMAQSLGVLIGLLLWAGCGSETNTDPVAEQLSRAKGWYDNGELDKAVAAADEAVRLDPKSAEAYHFRGSLWMAQGSNDKAMADYKAAMRLDPEYADALYVLGFGWFNRKEYEKAIAAYDEAIRIDPERARARDYYYRGNALDKTGQYGKALADYRQAVRLDADFALPYFSLGQLLSSCPASAYRDGQQAVDHATMACRLTQWKDWPVLDTLAAAYAEAGDFDRAVHWQTKTIEIAEEDEKITDINKKLLRYRLDLYEAGKPFRQER